MVVIVNGRMVWEERNETMFVIELSLLSLRSMLRAIVE